MPKLIEYPRASFERVLEMGAAIDYLGGDCSIQSCADQMKVKVTGAFNALMSAAKKHDIATNEKGKLYVTETYKKIRHPYDEDEKRQLLRQCFLAAPLYRKIYERFKAKELPLPMLNTLLIRDYGVEKEMSSRVTGYFVDGARTCELIVDNKLIDIDNGVANDVSQDSNSAKGEETSQSSFAGSSQNGAVVEDELALNINSGSLAKVENFTVHITGPGLNSKLVIAEEDDFLILEAMISKLKKKVKVDTREEF